MSYLSVNRLNKIPLPSGETFRFAPLKALKKEAGPAMNRSKPGGNSFKNGYGCEGPGRG